eukprot:TRINITY_DN7724_c0_g2_i1.p1 TRINITY_DN7724_c0_g2~~TRINITY_DN7724_c0_g2_i1.p1  ORF type:complete len:510 (-),score=62.49 TRINITY_DN7724_c0_g2_i1:93-1556(-)
MRWPLAICRTRTTLAWIDLALLALSFATRHDEEMDAERFLFGRPSMNNLHSLSSVLDNISSAVARAPQRLTVKSLDLNNVFEVPTAFFDDWFVYDFQFWGKSIKPDDAAREHAKELTRTTLARWLHHKSFAELRNAGYQASDIQTIANSGMSSSMRMTRLFRDVSSEPSPAESQMYAGGEFVLGRYEVLCAVTFANFDFEWKMISSTAPFYVAHAAALNVGESRKRQSTAYDFKDFAIDANNFDEDKYVKAMGRIVRLIMQAASHLGITDLVFFPFGMGAFLRNLKNIDQSYSSEAKMQRLREDLTHQFVEAFMSAPEIRIHVCLAFTPTDKRYINIETLGNTAAFLKAFRLVAANHTFKHKPIVWPDADSMQVALALASRNTEHKVTVMLVNGANRKKIGNHWYEAGAERAIDENLHRRSLVLSAISYLANKGFEDQDKRIKYDLSRQVEAMGGSVLLWKDGMLYKDEPSKNNRKFEEFKIYWNLE